MVNIELLCVNAETLQSHKAITISLLGAVIVKCIISML